MFADKRTYQIPPQADYTHRPAAELAEALTQHTWTLCTAFRRGNVLYLNDSTGENGAQEYAVLEIPEWPPLFGTITGIDFESVTFGWCSIEKATAYIEQYDKPEERESLKTEPWAKLLTVRIDTTSNHRCPACA